MFACSKVQAVKAYLHRYDLNDLNFTGPMRSGGAGLGGEKHNTTTTYALGALNCEVSGKMDC